MGEHDPPTVTAWSRCLHDPGLALERALQGPATFYMMYNPVTQPSTRSLTQRARARASRQTRLRDSGTSERE